MNESEIVNREAVQAYLDGARNALRSAQYNLDGGFYGVVVNRAYYAFFYAATALLLTCEMSLITKRWGMWVMLRLTLPLKMPTASSSTARPI